MGITLDKGRGLTEAEAILDAAGKNLWVTIQNTGGGAPEPLHWHHWDTHLYCISGAVRGLDPDDASVTLGPGDCCLVPARTVHAGHADEGTRLVVGASRELVSEVTLNHPPEALTAG